MKLSIQNQEVEKLTAIVQNLKKEKEEIVLILNKKESEMSSVASERKELCNENEKLFKELEETQAKVV